MIATSATAALDKELVMTSSFLIDLFERERLILFPSPARAPYNIVRSFETEPASGKNHFVIKNLQCAVRT
jgi:hypothetical protein